DWKSTDPGFVPESITAKFTEWVKDTNATTGHISLEHDLYPISSKMAPPSLDIVLGAKFQVEQVAKCVSESPYREFTGFPGDNSTSPSPAISSTSASVAMTPTTTLNNNGEEKKEITTSNGESSIEINNEDMEAIEINKSNLDEIENISATIQQIKESKMGILMHKMSEKTINNDTFNIVGRSLNL
ncbi:7011_t:CDS:2, partial [Entrophospora sp. SA101]